MVLNTEWPRNIIEQQAWMDRLDKTVQQVEKRATEVTLVQANEPIQQEWEDAYFEQTGFPPPIPQGTSLFWWGLDSGKLKRYATVKDTEGGLDSSYSVRPFISNPTPRSPFRAIGHFVNGRMMNGYTGITLRRTLNASVYTPISIHIDPKVWADRGLAGIMMIFSARCDNYTTADAPRLCFQFSLDNGGGADYMWFEPNQYISGGFTECAIDSSVFFDNPTITTEGNNILFNLATNRFERFGPVANSSDPADLYTEGILYITGFDWLKDDNDNYVVPGGGNMMMYGMGTHVDQSVATGNLRFWMGGTEIFGTSPIQNALPGLVATQNAAAGSVNDFVEDGDLQGTIYGWFAKEGTPQDLGEIE
jgi:hypothetical protein